MDLLHLIRMANQIGAFFEAMPDRAEALEGTARHVRNFWEPRMRRELLDHMDAGCPAVHATAHAAPAGAADGPDDEDAAAAPVALSPFVREALTVHRPLFG